MRAPLAAAEDRSSPTPPRPYVEVKEMARPPGADPWGADGDSGRQWAAARSVRPRSARKRQMQKQ